MCYVKYKSHTADTAVTAKDAILVARHNASASSPVDLKKTESNPGNVVGQLLFSRSDITKGGSGTTHTFPVSGDRNVDTNGNNASGDNHTVKVNKVNSKEGDAAANLVIKVAANQNYCHVWNNTTDEEVFRSEN